MPENTCPNCKDGLVVLGHVLCSGCEKTHETMLAVKVALDDNPGMSVPEIVAQWGKEAQAEIPKNAENEERQFRDLRDAGVLETPDIQVKAIESLLNRAGFCGSDFVGDSVKQVQRLLESYGFRHESLRRAVKERDRLKGINADLLAALGWAVPQVESIIEELDPLDWALDHPGEVDPIVVGRDRMKAAIAKALGE